MQRALGALGAQGEAVHAGRSPTLTGQLVAAFLVATAAWPLCAQPLVDSTTTALAPSSSNDRLSMVGLAGVNVDVTVQCPSGQFMQLVGGEVLRSKIELRLRSAGIRVYDDLASNTDPRYASLFLSVNAVPTLDRDDSGNPLAYAIAMRMYLNQKLWVVTRGTPQRALLGDTWYRSEVMCYGSTTLRNGDLVHLVDDWMDVFVNDWLAAHPR